MSVLIAILDQSTTTLSITSAARLYLSTTDLLPVHIKFCVESSVTCMHAIVLSHDSILKFKLWAKFKIGDNYTSKMMVNLLHNLRREVELDAAQGLFIRRVVVRIPLLQNTVRCGEY